MVKSKLVLTITNELGRCIFSVGNINQPYFSSNSHGTLMVV